MTAFCETEDVRLALQQASTEYGSGSLATDMVEAAITGVTQWFARATNGHWYDSGGVASDLVDTAGASASNVRLDVPSSPHRQDRMLLSDHQGIRYPVTHDGPYARIPLPHPYVETVTTLEVRDRGGGVEDWVAATDMVEGRGEDYYVQQRGQNSYGRTYLYVRAASIGARMDFGGLLTLAYNHGLDYQTEAWDDVKRGVAAIAAAELVVDDNVLSQIPDNGQLIGVDTQADQLLNIALGERGTLSPYLNTPVA